MVFCPRETAPLLTPTHLVVLARNLLVWTPAGSSGTTTAGIPWMLRKLLARFTMLRSARVLAVSSVMARALPKKVGESAVVVHHGCDLEPVEQSRLDGACTPESLRIVAIGVINEHKRFDTLIDAVAALRAQGQPAQLEIWGPEDDAECSEALRQKSCPGVWTLERGGARYG